jgi:hypothetical protein
MDAFRNAVVEESVGGAMSQGAYAFQDVIRLGLRWLSNLER